MKRLRFSEAQIAFVLRQAEDGAAIGEVCRSSRTARTGISEATFYTWRKKYAGLLPSEMRRPGDQRQTCLPALQEVGPSAEEQGAQAASEGQAPG